MKYNILRLSFLSFSLFFLFTFNSNAQITVDNLSDGPANAGNCEIDAAPTGDNCSLRDAVEAANTNPGADEIIFDSIILLPDTITLSSGEITITDDLTITGPGADMLTIDADNLSRIFMVSGSSFTDLINVEIIGITFTNGFVTAVMAGFDDGGAIFNDEDLTLESCNFEGNGGERSGGAIFNSGFGVMEIRNNNFTLNFINSGNSRLGGGAINNNGTINNIINSSFTSNSLDIPISFVSGGAIRNQGQINNIIGSVFQNNTADNPPTSTRVGEGGAISNNTGARIQNIIDTQFLSNSAFIAGGAINNELDATIGLIDNCDFDDNSTNINFNGSGIPNSLQTSFGGAINNISGTISEIRNSTFNNNTSITGGAISSQTAAFGIRDGEITNINNSTFSNNMANAEDAFSTANSNGSGGAIQFGITSATTNILNSTFFNNVFNSPNVSNPGGGAIFIEGFSAIDVLNISFSTFFGNTTALEGANAEDINIRNSIIAFSTDDNCDISYIDTASETNNYSDDDSCGFGTTLITLGNLTGTLESNGGPTDTIRLNGGPALDGASLACDPLNQGGIANGVRLDEDQRHFARPQEIDGLCDAGAFEVGAAPVTVEIILTKISIPSGGADFDFTSSGFDGLFGCGITDSFMMNDDDQIICDIPTNIEYTIDEDIPVDQQLEIICTQSPNGLIMNNLTGELTFTPIEADDNINCVYINSRANSLVLVTDEPAGANCEFGGQRIDTGIDDNFDNILSAGEVDDTQFVCNTPEANALVVVSDEPAGANCEFGGSKIDTGLDTNFDDILDPGEINDTQFVCNTQLPATTPGDDDDDDDDDTAQGNDLVDLNVEPAGFNCPNGGVRIDSGNDDNGDGILQENEIDETSFACSLIQGADGNSENSDCNTLVGGSPDEMTVFSALFPFLLIPLVVVWRRKKYQHK